MVSSPASQNLQRATPESQGIASSAVLQFIDEVERQIHEIHSIMLLRHGKVIAEGWWSPYGHEHPHLLFSLSKSFTSTAVGFAIAEGYFSIDDLVLSFFSDEIPVEASDLLAAMRVRDLLSMSTGHSIDTWSAMVDRSDGNWIKGFLSVPVLHAPGTRFVYNTGAAYMLSAIVQKTTGIKLLDFLQPRLFAPLGIENVTWQESPQGITAGGIGLSLKTEDVAKFGQLYLQKGKWQDRQLLLESWVEQSTSPQISNSDGVQNDWTQGYGYQFWRCRHGAYRGDGVFGQYCIIMPEQNAVLAITSGIDIFDMQQPLNLIWEMLLPAMRPDSLPDNATVQATLSKKLSTLSLMPVQGQISSPIALQISGQTYAADVNELGIETIVFNFNEADCTVSLKTSAGEERISCGYGEWLRGQSSTLFSQPKLFSCTPITTSGAWATEDTFKMIIRQYETPFYHTLVCHFIGDEILIDTQVNVSLESMKPLLLTAKYLQ
jgi:CubicO group peptidase (beta-lactamase class C family)